MRHYWVAAGRARGRRGETQGEGRGVGQKRATKLLARDWMEMCDGGVVCVRVPSLGARRRVCDGADLCRRVR